MVALWSHDIRLLAPPRRPMPTTPRGKPKAPKRILAGGIKSEAETEAEACLPPRKKSRGGMGPSKGASKVSPDAGEGLG